MKLPPLRLASLAQRCSQRLHRQQIDPSIVDAHEDFELTGTLDFKFGNILGKEAWWRARIGRPAGTICGFLRKSGKTGRAIHCSAVVLACRRAWFCRRGPDDVLNR